MDDFDSKGKLLRGFHVVSCIVVALKAILVRDLPGDDLNGRERYGPSVVYWQNGLYLYCGSTVASTAKKAELRQEGVAGV